MILEAGPGVPVEFGSTASTDPGAGSAGRFTARLEQATRLQAGIYQLRLEHAGRSVSRKVSILR